MEEDDAEPRALCGFVVRGRGLRCLGLYCILDTKLCQDSFDFILQHTAKGNSFDIREIALKATFDLIITHGFPFVLQSKVRQLGGGEEAFREAQQDLISAFLDDLFDDVVDIQAITADVLVLKSEYNTAWDFFNVHELSSIMKDGWAQSMWIHAHLNPEIMSDLPPVVQQAKPVG